MIVVRVEHWPLGSKQCQIAEVHISLKQTDDSGSTGEYEVTMREDYAREWPGGRFRQCPEPPETTVRIGGFDRRDLDAVDLAARALLAVTRYRDMDNDGRVVYHAKEPD